MQKIQTELDMQTIRETAYFKSMDAAFKVGLTIYVESTLNGIPTTAIYLSQVLKEDLSLKNIESALNALNAWGLVRERFGETKDGHAGYIRELTSVGKDQFEQNYKELKKTLVKK